MYRMLSSELEKPPKGGGPQEGRRGAAILGKTTGTGSGDSQAGRSRRNTQRSMASSTALMAKGQGSTEPGVEGRFLPSEQETADHTAANSKKPC